MKKFTLLASLLSATAFAQAPVPTVTYAPVTIDGVTTANGLVTINNRQFVSVDALLKGHVTKLASGSLGVYTFPATPGARPLQLRGCLNEWLTDGTTRVRVTGHELKSGWEVTLQWQTTQDDMIAFDNVFQSDQALLQLKNNAVMDAKVDRLVRSTSSVAAATRGSIGEGVMVFFGADLAQRNTPIKMVLRPLTGAPWTFDLTCKR